ncbi:tripartite tricarboxylate transporter TctB family protein [Alkalibacter mobilis]|uniref:tripartite tricarboxylate transporter TctB family protein n=1 Tax=Alkalibacter mobilis TaxID=2787712 RepID=UPI00189C7E72|nr:tripartite tricarboxylate transporter TctB family protein [Alkalibacter mobilis]MBF7096640.1 tripartite tricarboxylate transporter TctB family protein [Alkalibacter mobilis]
MSLSKKKEIAFGIIIVILGAFYLFMTYQIESKPGVVDARTVPKILGFLMVLLGGIQIFETLKLKSKEEESKSIDTGTVVKTSSLILVYIAVFNKIGFLLSTIIFLFLQFSILAPNDMKGRKYFVINGIIAILVSLLVYMSFRYGLKIMLPQGIVTFI